MIAFYSYNMELSMSDIINIGNRREVFWDDSIIDPENTGAAYTVHHPIKRECVITLDGPDASHPSPYSCLVKYNGIYMFYISGNKTMFCYQSKDGINWEAPDYDIDDRIGSLGGGKNSIFSHDENSPYYDDTEFDGFKVFVDTNPNCKEEERFKAVANKLEHKLTLYTSPDGIHWTRQYEFSITAGFDSQNTLLYDEHTQKYRMFFRDFHPAPDPNETRWWRDIRTSESSDLKNWSPKKILHFDDYIDWQLYTNGIIKYYRAPHIFVGFPARYIERLGWSPNFDDLCGLEARKTRRGRHATALTDTLFMTSRDGLNWKRYPNAYITPGPEYETNWEYGSCYVCDGIAESPSTHPGCDNELSLYIPENRWSDEPVKIYRHTVRLDGFVSLFGPWHGTVIYTKPFIFDGDELYINFSTSAYGYLNVQIKALDGSETISTNEIFGDSTNRHVRFKNDKTPSLLKGKPVVMKIEVKDAHLYSFKFE